MISIIQKFWFLIRVDLDLGIQESQNLLQDSRPPTVLFHLAGSTEVLLPFFTSSEEMVVATITDDVTLRTLVESHRSGDHLATHGTLDGPVVGGLKPRVAI